jgi:autoinducer 2 (AI-2) kinase
MYKSDKSILAIDVSSNLIKVAVLSEDLRIINRCDKKLIIEDEDHEGFAKKIDLNDLWNKAKLILAELVQKTDLNRREILGISSCAQRIACVFLDKKDNVIYAGPNSDVRGIDSAYLIDDKYSEEEIFAITGHSPSLLFCLARLLWYKEEREDLYNKIAKVLMLDDWIAYKLTGVFCSDVTSAGESQFLDIERREWSDEVFEAFDIDPDLFPDLVDCGATIGDVKHNILKDLKITQSNLPFIKTGGDTQASLVGMGAINKCDIGITLGTTAPVQLVMDRPYFDPECNYWSLCHSIKGRWLVEAHSGNTGTAYDWFKHNFLELLSDTPDQLLDDYLRQTKPAHSNVYSFLGPEHMNIKNQTSIKRGVFVFPPPMMITEDLPQIKDFARSLIENITFGLYENYVKVKEIVNNPPVVYCAGGMTNSEEFCQIMAHVLNSELKSPYIKDSAFVGAAMNVLNGLKLHVGYDVLKDKYIDFFEFKPEEKASKLYEKVYFEWKRLKNKLDHL